MSIINEAFKMNECPRVANTGSDRAETTHNQNKENKIQKKRERKAKLIKKKQKKTKRNETEPNGN